MIKCIVSDLDETLLDNNKRISNKNYEAIQYAMNKGIKFVFATGRGYTSIQQYLELLDIKKKDEYAITNNGAILTDNEENSILCCHTIPWNVVEAIIQFGLRHNLCIQVFLPEDVYAFNCGEDERDVLLSFKKDAIIVENVDYSFLKGETIVKVMYQYPNYEYLPTLEDTLDDMIKENTTVSYSSHRYMEFTSKGVSKATGIVELCKLLNITLDEVLSIGDNMNDYAMLELVENSACVANAVDEVKNVCKYVSFYTNNEDAIADILEHFLG